MVLRSLKLPLSVAFPAKEALTSAVLLLSVRVATEKQRCKRLIERKKHQSERTDLQDSLLDSILDDETGNEYRLGLAKAMNSIDRLTVTSDGDSYQHWISGVMIVAPHLSTASFPMICRTSSLILITDHLDRG
jgi:hypothetical protein